MTEQPSSIATKLAILNSSEISSLWYYIQQMHVCRAHSKHADKDYHSHCL